MPIFAVCKKIARSTMDASEPQKPMMSPKSASISTVDDNVTINTACGI